MSVKVKGLDNVLRDLDKKSKDVVIAVADVLEDVAKKIEIGAKQDAPSFVPQIPELSLDVGQRVTSNPLEYFNGEVIAWEVFVRTDPDDRMSDFDGYMEFNTGLQASELLSRPDYTQEIRDLAIKYFKTGKGTLRGKPFFYPNVFRYTANIEERLEKAINDNIK